MRRLSLAFVLVLLAQLPAQVWANTLPEKIGFTIYQRGVEVGRSDITVTETAAELVLESKTTMRFGNETMDLSCRTVADPKTFLVRSFDFFGTKSGTKLDGQMFVEGDSIYGTVMRDNSEKADYRISPLKKNLFMEDFIMEHEVLLALTHSVSEENPCEYGMMFPATFGLSRASLAFASTLEIESDTKAAVCKKLLVSIQGSEPFASYWDPKRKLPVYMAFPQTNVEVFLDEFFGDSPISRYRD
jgi:hypothetical protein